MDEFIIWARNQAKAYTDSVAAIGGVLTDIYRDPQGYLQFIYTPTGGTARTINAGFVPPGKSVTSGEVNAAGHLILTFDDMSTHDVGLVKGPKGDKGDTGDKGGTGDKGDPGADGEILIAGANIDIDRITDPDNPVISAKLAGAYLLPAGILLDKRINVTIFVPLTELSDTIPLVQDVTLFNDADGTIGVYRGTSPIPQPQAIISTASVSGSGGGSMPEPEDDGDVYGRSRESGQPTGTWKKIQGGTGTTRHSELSERELDDQHPISAIEGLETALGEKLDSSDFDPNVFATAAQGDKADSAYQKPQDGIPASDMEQSVQDSLALADSSVQPSAISDFVSTSDSRLSDARTPLAHNQAISTITGLQDELDGFDGSISDITDLIPVQAAPTNQLADKAFVNSSISNMAARYVTPDPAGLMQWESLTALQTGPWYNGGTPYQPTQADYAIFINVDDSVWRATYSGDLWTPTYKINDTPFTAGQIAALNSNITAALVNTLANPDAVPTENSDGLVKSGGVFSWVMGFLGALPSTLKTTAKTVIGAINELFDNKLDKTAQAADSAMLSGQLPGAFMPKNVTELTATTAPATLFEILTTFGPGSYTIPNAQANAMPDKPFDAALLNIVSIDFVTRSNNVGYAILTERNAGNLPTRQFIRTTNAGDWGNEWSAVGSTSVALNTGQDLNDIMQPGFYSGGTGAIDSLLNKPTEWVNGSNATLFVEYGSTNTRKQTITMIRTDASGGRTFARIKASATHNWSPWREIATRNWAMPRTNVEIWADANLTTLFGGTSYNLQYLLQTFGFGSFAFEGTAVDNFTDLPQIPTTARSYTMYEYISGHGDWGYVRVTARGSGSHMVQFIRNVTNNHAWNGDWIQIAKSLNYSTTEQPTGRKDENGNDIFQITRTGTTGNAGAWNNIGAVIPNFGKLIKLERANCVSNTGSNIPHGTYTSTIAFSVTVNAGQIQEDHVGTSLNSRPVEVTVEYTKA